MIILMLIRNLFITGLIEGALIGMIYKRKRFIYYSILCNLLTNPAANVILIIMMKLTAGNYYSPAVVVVEIVVVFVEAYLYRMLGEFSKKKAFLLSSGLNLSSYLTGYILVSCIVIF